MSGLRVLVVDDEPDMLLMIRMMLELAGHSVTSAETGEAALDAIAADRPDVVVLDIRLPGMDGWQVVECLRADPATAELPVVMISAGTDPTYAARAARFGCRDFVPKPLLAQRLLEAVDGLAHA